MPWLTFAFLLILAACRDNSFCIAYQMVDEL